jgi:hypothetical protein
MNTLNRIVYFAGAFVIMCFAVSSHIHLGDAGLAIAFTILAILMAGVAIFTPEQKD